jgi:MurNAc alpha-1-phosphate uridylyltransferase
MMVPSRAIVLSAGLGLRMRPLTDHLPKPLVAVAGRTLLDRALDRCAAAGIETVVVNTHHLAGQIERHLATRTKPRVVLSHETELLDTGGGVAKALPHLLPGPFYAINSDSLWLDGAQDTLHRLAAAWDGQRMDALLLLQATADLLGYDGPGDFHRAPDGRLSRRREGARAPYVFIGVQLLAAGLLEGVAVEKFSLNRLYDKAMAAGRLYGLVHDGAAFHVGTPDAIAPTARALAATATGGNG